MSGWGDKDKLDAARALQATFFGRSPGSPGSRGGAIGRGRGRGRGHGSVSPGPVHGLDNSGTSSSGGGNNNNMTSAGRGRGGFGGNNDNMTSAGRGRGGFGGNNTARGGGQRPTAHLATPNEFFAVLNKDNKTAGHTVGTTAVSSAPGTSSGAAQKIVGMHADTSGGPMEIDKPARPNDNAAITRDMSHGLMASQWANASVVAGHTHGDTAMGGGNSGQSVGRYSGTGAHSVAHKKTVQRAESLQGAQSTAGTKAGLSSSRWAGPSPPSPPSPPPPNPSELPPVYRSENWIKDYHEEHKSKATPQGRLPQVGPAGQANGGPRGSNTQPAVHTSQVNGQHNTRPNAQPTLNLSGGGIAVQPAQQPSQTAHRIVGNAGQHSAQFPQPFQQPSQTAHRIVGNAGQHSAQSSQPVQQPSQSAHRIGGNTGQQSAQSSQRSQDPFDDPDFKDFWENHYMRNKG
ncbi:hypothetical protein VPNG_03966 [Cytospora leucostoma]|uniref:Uncharacterized protein n=1 Tax=Cytospora leucostoma TaxID=1230097 RepID=A0A423XDV9_9PEZI|nr:hypothetical protein VPNG_03966 [Cytospora leucostoma]